ncbi:7076_t:CDS:2 [Scutellospora calospora]|uniref:7076_t:CDS:1 n=1 Tax=Scutellospora calospora TaxID=85575 RepID=A0ACA9K8E0_9GLOM|nr:7076_t:CDS:2 [Scutellospora calospora]
MSIDSAITQKIFGKYELKETAFPYTNKGIFNINLSIKSLKGYPDGIFSIDFSIKPLIGYPDGNTTARNNILSVPFIKT